MILGVDFDNTLVCYDGLFHAAALAKNMMPGDGPRDKDGVRDWLIARGREDDFTLLQGEVYGPGLRDAPAYPGARACLAKVIGGGGAVRIVSHKTERPVLGPPHDLRRAALDWLEAMGFFAPGMLRPEQVFFENTMAEKSARIAALECSYFVDDMKRFLDRADFPRRAGKIWFAPDGGAAAPGMARFASWAGIADYLAARKCDNRI